MKKMKFLLTSSLLLGGLVALCNNAQPVVADAAGVSTYTKVTADRSDWSGQYLIVCEDSGVAFNGSLAALDAASNNIGVEIVNNSIESDSMYSFTIAAVSGGYSIQSASGYYIGNTDNSNKLNSSINTQYTNTISFNNDGSVQIVGSGSSVLRYNAAKDNYRFRYFKSSTYTSQKPIQLYRLNDNTEAPLDPTLEELKISDTSAKLAYNYTCTQSENEIENYTGEMNCDSTYILSTTDAKANAENLGFDSNFISIALDKQNKSSSQYNDSLRLYKSDSLIITTDKVITSISLASTSTTNPITQGTIKVGSNDAIQISSTNYSQTFNEDDGVKEITLCAKDAQVRFTSIIITVAGGGKQIVKEFDYSTFAVRFGGLIANETWTKLLDEKEVSGYGVLVALKDNLGTSTLEDKFEEAVAAAEENSTTWEDEIDTNVKTNAKVSVNSEDEIDILEYEDNEGKGYVVFNAYVPVPVANVSTEISAVAYVVVDGEYVFMKERTESVKSLAEIYIEKTTELGLTADVVDSLEGIVAL